ncbi:MAG: O-antigen ligase family protein [Candidatus Obscuribacterales bacterium]|nr:O-antigen ligase family protein [Candidatus Obscuribacterales bacterium]
MKVMDYAAPAKRLLPVEKWVAYAYAASLPLSMTASWGLFIVGLVIRCVLLLDARARQETKAAILSAPLTIPLAVFAVSVAISGAFNSEPTYGQWGSGALGEAWNSLGTLKNLLPYFWAAVVLRAHARMSRNALLLLLLVSSVAGVWGTIQQVFNIHPGYKYLQGTGFLGGPMAFAGQMQMFSLLSLAFLLTGAFRMNRIDAAACAEGEEPPRADFVEKGFPFLQNKYAFATVVVANYAGVLFAGERSAWLGAFAGTGTLCWLYWRKIPLKLLAAGTIAIVICLTSVPLVKTRFQTLLSGKDVSISARQTIWQSCLELIPQSPVVGVGIRRFPHFDMPEAIVPGVSKDLNHAHSNYFHLLTTTGTLGLAAYFGVVTCFFIAARKKLSESRKSGNAFECALALALISALVSLMVSGIFEYNFGTAQVRLAQWFLFGLL